MKNYMFTLSQRKQFLEETFREYDKVEIDSYQGLTVDYCLEKNSKFILRGLRNPADFEFEKAIAHTNRAMTHRDIETVFLLTASGKSYISSSIVREIIRYDGDFSMLVPEAVKIAKI